MEHTDFIQMLDAVLKQTVESSRSKKAVIEAVRGFRQTVLEEDDLSWFEQTDPSSLELTDLITGLRTKHRKVQDPPIIFPLLYTLLKLQVRYYALSGDSDKDTLKEYLYLVAHHKGLYAEVCEVLQEKFNLQPIKFHYDVGLPFQRNLEKVRAYADSLEIAVNATYNMISMELGPRCKGMGPFFLFHHKIIGNETEWGKTIEYWSVCRKAYTLHKVERLSKADVVRTLSASSLSRAHAFNPELIGMANATHKLDRYLADAENLVAAAAQGSFPY
uniref:Uncharacterized protein n=1 Tax=Geobacter sp. (strain M21) TaxID=443144 RepID=C6E4K7_GEOSM